MKDKNKKKIAPVIITALVIVFSLLYVLFFVYMVIAERSTWIIAAVGIAVYIAICVGIVIALRSRIKEINGGEEDEALKY